MPPALQINDIVLWRKGLSAEYLCVIAVTEQYIIACPIVFEVRQNDGAFYPVVDIKDPKVFDIVNSPLWFAYKYEQLLEITEHLNIQQDERSSLQTFKR